MAAPGTLLTPAQARELPAIPNNKTGACVHVQIGLGPAARLCADSSVG